MNTKLVIWTYNPDVAITDEVKTNHGGYLKTLITDGALIAAGPRSDVAGGVLVFAETTDQKLADLLANDPYTLAGVIATTSIIDWNASLGALAELPQ